MNWYEILPTLMNMTLTASIVIIFVLLLRLVLRKAPKQYSYILWMIVLFRLLCPITISSPVSLLNLFDTPVTEMGSMEYVPVDIVHTPHPAISLPSKTVNDAVNAVLPQGEEQLRADPLEAPITILTYIWLLGMVTMLGYSLVQFTALRAKLVCAVEIDKRIFLADDIDTSFVIGILHPRVYLPSALSETEQTYILMHERYHIRRLDHIVKLFAFAALCIHWFNPLVWFAFILFGKDMEMSCDEAVMRGMEGDIRAAYAQSLLQFTTGKRIIAGAPLAFGEGDTKARVKNVMRYRKPALWIGIAAVIVCAAAATALSTNPMEKTGEAVIPATRDEIARTIYGVSQVIYDAPMFSFVLTPANAPLYMISDTMELHSDEITQFSDGETENGFILRGTMTEVKLSKENFDDLFEELDYMPWTNDRAAQLRKDNEKTWRVDDLINPNDVFYYILKQKNGDIYLSYGYDDPEGETDPASDDSHDPLADAA